MQFVLIHKSNGSAPPEMMKFTLENVSDCVRIPNNSCLEVR
jgi:hypothetical protein